MRRVHSTTFVASLSILMLMIAVPYEKPASADEGYSWPKYQNGLKPGPSNSPVKARLPEMGEVPNAHTAYDGIWGGWMCRNKTVDVKVAITNFSPTGALVTYASGAESFGQFSQSLIGIFNGDTLQGKFSSGIPLILGMRSDGYLNIKFESRQPCTGILQKMT